MSGITKTPRKINFYTFYQVLDYAMEQQNIIWKRIKSFSPKISFDGANN